MTIAHLFILLLLAGAAGILVSIVRRVRLWHKGKGAAATKWSALLTIPKRYFVDLHHIVMRDAYIAYTHIAVAGGAAAALLLLVLIYIGGMMNFFLYLLVLSFLTLSLLGGFFVLGRRIRKPPRLSGGKWNLVPYVIIAFSASSLLLVLIDAGLVPASPEMSYALAIVAAAGLFEITYSGLFNHPFKHIFTGSLNLAFHPRQQRFYKESGEPGKQGRIAALKPLEEGESGVRSSADFSWNQLLNFDACVECGRCEAACPAFAAAQPLNPKKLIQDMVASMEGSANAGYAGSNTPGLEEWEESRDPATHGAADSITGTWVAEDSLWSCTTCRACVYECPMFVEHVDAIVDLRRNLTLQQGRIPEQSFAALENLRNTDNPEGNDPAQRANWALDLNVRILAAGDRTSILLYAGQAAYELRNQNTLRQLVRLLQQAELDFGILGNDELDTGDLARRLGDEVLFDSLAARNVARLKQVSFDRIVTADPHVYHSLKNEYAAYGADYKVVHHTELLLELIEKGKLKVNSQGDEDVQFAYHDPCYLGRYNGIIDAPRQLLKKLNVNLVELERSGMRARCCGWGGGAAYSDVAGKRRIPDMRMDDARAKQVDQLVVACPNCMTMLEGVVEPRPQVMDIVELISRSVYGSSA